MTFFNELTGEFIFGGYIGYWEATKEKELEEEMGQ